VDNSDATAREVGRIDNGRVTTQDAAAPRWARELTEEVRTRKPDHPPKTTPALEQNDDGRESAPKPRTPPEPARGYAASLKQKRTGPPRSI
jgi:hypothetical protein